MVREWPQAALFNKQSRGPSKRLKLDVLSLGGQLHAARRCFAISWG